MSLLKINKYIIKLIFSFLNNNTLLKIVQYNKELQSKLFINKYTYQKNFFNSIITPYYSKNISILLNYFDEETLLKLKSEWDNETTGIFEDKEIFNKEIKPSKNLNEIKILNIKDNLYNFNLNSKMPNLIELNLSNLAYIALPCSILIHLQKLSFDDITNLKIISEECIINLNKLKYFYSNSLKAIENENLKINMNNLEYLHLIIIYKTDDLDFYTKIFGFKFLEKFLTNYYENKNEIFKEEHFGKYNYFNLKYNHEINEGRFMDKYGYDHEHYSDFNWIYSKTKENKCFLKTILEDGDRHKYKYRKEEIVYKNNIKDEKCFFTNKELSLSGYFYTVMNKLEENNKINMENIFEELNSLIIESDNFYLDDNNSECEDNENKEDDSENIVDGSDIIEIFKVIKSNNYSLEYISIDVLDIEYYPNFIEKIKLFLELKFFYVHKDCKMSNKEMVQLLTNLSQLKSLCEIKITKENLNLDNIEKSNILKLFEGISINGNEIEWKK